MESSPSKQNKGIGGGFGGLGSEQRQSERGSREERVLSQMAEPRFPHTKAVKWWKEALSEPLPFSSTNVNLKDTLPYMEGRKSLRRFRGAYQKTRPALAWFMFLLLLALWTYRGSQVTSQSVSASFQLSLGFGTATRFEYIVLLVLVLFYMLASIRLMTQYNLAYSWVITTVFVLLSIGDVAVAAAYPTYAEQAIVLRDSLLALFLLVQAAYLLVAYVLRHWVPYLQMRGWFLVKISLLDEKAAMPLEEVAAAIPRDPAYRAVREMGYVASSAFTYVQVLMPAFRLCVFRKETISYSGEVDSENRPHGYGLWYDSHWHGETLEGWWVHGVPTAPFKSRETGSGSGFRSLRIPYVRCRRDDVRELRLLPAFGPITVGVATAECSVSGFFFRDYPIVRFLEGPVSPLELPDKDTGKGGGRAVRRVPVARIAAGLKWMLGQLFSLPMEDQSSSVVITADPVLGLRAGGFYQSDNAAKGAAAIPAMRLRASPANDQDADRGDDPTAELQPPEGPTPPSRPGSGIMAAMAAAPAPRPAFTGDIEIDGWRSCYAPEHREAILYIHGYNSPTDWGVKGLGQLMALGSFPSYLKPFVFSWPTGKLWAFLAAKRASVAEETTDALVDTVKGFDAAGFKRLHILTHSMGVRTLTAALPKLVSLVSGTRDPEGGSPRRPGAGGETSDAASFPGGLTISTVTLLNPEHGLVDFIRSCAQPLRVLSPVVTIYGDLRDTALFGASLWNSLDATFLQRAPKKADESDMPSVGADPDTTCCCGTIIYERSLGKNIYNIKGPYGETFDIDVIDTTFLEANVHSVRHNAFSLNRDIVEDLRDIMTTQRRAAQRQRLEPRGGNVFSFMVAPSYVVQPSQ